MRRSSGTGRAGRRHLALGREDQAADAAVELIHQPAPVLVPQDDRKVADDRLDGAAGREHGGHLERGALEPDLVGDGTAVQLGELRLVIEQIDVGGGAVLKEVDDPFGPWGEVRECGWSRGVGRGRGGWERGGRTEAVTAEESRQGGELREENYVSKIYPKMIAGRLWSAIQVTTAAGIAAVVDLVLRTPGRYRGFVR